jgi:hypothetical protein
MTRFRPAAAWSLAIAFSAWLGRAELHTDDTGILAGLIGIGAFLSGVIEPRRAWIWGIVVPCGIIAVNAWHHSVAWLGIAAFTLAIGCAGAYAGALIRR